MHQEEELELSQQDIIDILQQFGACSKKSAVPLRKIQSILHKSNAADTVKRLRKHGEIAFDMREYGRYYYWLPRQV